MYNTSFSDIIIIGCGGAGLRAAIEAKKLNCNVKILGKRKKDDAHTVLAAGGINAAFGNLDKKDSWIQHFIDTYEEGYGIGDPDQIEILVKYHPRKKSECISLLRTQNDAFPNNSSILYLLSDLLIQSEQYTESLEFIQQIIQSHHSYSDKCLLLIISCLITIRSVIKKIGKKL